MNNIRTYFSLLIVFVCLFAYSLVSAQSLPQNLSNFNVDDYSDSQLKDAMQNAQSQGLSDAQFIQMAQSRGLSTAQVQRLQTRIADIRKKGGNNTTVGDTSLDQSNRKINSQQNDPRSDQDDALSLFTDRSKIFGAKLFRNSKANTFQPNLKLATPVNYIVGPDDKLHISVYGNSLANWQLTVSSEGNINIPGVGVLNVAGKTIEQAIIAIKGKLAANNYAIDKGTSVQVSLGDIRTINVILQGELVKPGTYSLSSLSTAFDALYAAGGPNDIGSFRKIDIIFNDQQNRFISMNLIVFLLLLVRFLVFGNF